MLDSVAAALRNAAGAYGERLVAIAVSVPGTVSETTLVQAPSLGWEQVSLAVLDPAGGPARPFLAGNDASWSAIGEVHRGAAAGHASSLHLFMDSGVGGALIDGGRLTAGAHGMGGEFGHLPLGSPRRRCRCGARGCWNTELDGAALAAALDRPLPADEVTFLRATLAAAADGAPAERRAVRAMARSLGRGAAGLVNACDPEVVVLSGLAGVLPEVAGEPLTVAYRDGLMAARADAPVPLVPGVLGERGPLVGAAEGAFAAWLGS